METLYKYELEKLTIFKLGPYESVSGLLATFLLADCDFTASQVPLTFVTANAKWHNYNQ